MIGYYLLFWPALLVLAVGNGVVRERGYGRHMSELHAHQLSTATAIVVVGVAVWVFSRYQPIGSIAHALLIGIIWLGLTVAFEFVLGRFVAGHGWKRLLRDYDLRAGRVWVLFLAWILVLPIFVCLAGAGSVG